MRRAFCGGGMGVRQHRSRLCLEVLEGRCLPSMVSNLTDHDPGSLRDAIAMTPSGGTVDFQPGLSGTIILTSGELAIRKDLIIDGPGADVITVSGNKASRVFNIAKVTVAISGLSIADGKVGSVGSQRTYGGGIYNLGTLTITGCGFRGNTAGLDGGGIFNYGTLTVTGCTFSGNSAFNGGGISTYGTLTITDSTFSDNYAGGNGGGMYNSGTLKVDGSTLSGNSANPVGGGIFNTGTLTITDSTFGGNSASDFGGGIANDGTLIITDSTFSGNSSTFEGGGIANGGTLTITDSTFSGNSADRGGGIDNSGGSMRIRNTLLARNRGSVKGPDVSGPVQSQGHNLIGDGTGGSGYAATDLVGTSANPINPKLGPLQDNGGPTPTMALLPGSPALDAGALTDSEWDQRGPGYSRLVNGATDIGAFEVQQPGTVPVTRRRVFPKVTILVAETPRSQPSAPALSVSGDSAPNMPVRPVVAAVDRVFASGTSEAAGLIVGRSRHAVPWPLDVFPAA